MKKLIALGLAVILVLTLGVGTVFAGGDQIPSTKAAADSGYIGPIDYGVPTMVMDVSIKTGTPKDLIINVALESSLYTKNRIKGSAETEAEATVAVQVRVDNVVIGPRWVVFNDRLVGLKGDLSHLNIEEPSHWIELFLRTKSANAFSWIARDVGPNISHVEVWAKVTTRTAAAGEGGDNGTAAMARALIGNGVVVVDEVNLKDS